MQPGCRDFLLLDPFIAVELKKLYQIFLSCGSVSTDTRQIEPGQLFVALKGAHFNGNKFARLALDKGASYVLVDDPEVVIDDRYILTNDTLKTLQDLAHHHRNTLRIPVFGLTGSNGKTTTKELLLAVLSTRYKVTATQGNLNNHIGVPLTILQASGNTEILLVEMGTNQPGDIELLCRIALPDFGLITNIGAAHLELLRDLDGVLTEKGQLFKYVIDRKGIFFLNTGDPYLRKLEKSGNDISEYSKEEGLFGTLSYVSGQKTNGSSYSIVHAGKHFRLESHLTGAYNQENIAAALHVAMYFRISLPDAIKAISAYLPSNMRSEIRRTARNTIVLDAYNANPSSMKLSIEAFINSYVQPGVKYALILGDMLELGVKELQYHQEIVDLLKVNSIKNVFLTGRIFSACKNGEFKAFTDVGELQNSGLLEQLDGHLILIKGSRGIRLESLLPFL